MTERSVQATAEVPTGQRLGAVLKLGERPPKPSALSASLTFGWRALLKIKHVPEQLVDITVFPAILTLMFTHLFGGALAGSTREYIQYFLPGIMVLSILMITMYTGVAINLDMEKGIFDRFRTLPIWRPAPMVGYLLGDAFRYLAAALVILGLGLLLGFRPEGGVSGVIGGVALLVAFCFAVSWVWTVLGLVMRGEKAVMSFSMMVIFPLTFLSNVFVDPKTMPGWLEAAVNVNPVTILTTGVRGLMNGTATTGDVTLVLIVSAAIMVVFGALTVRLYNRK
ncbi:ABC transporter permease [Solwaraspora sp. WMMA2056]|uniref:ABC transporter permease n=1 Tax=Solwaraspora sp. WMMA2056 TaxID=3015161 RepID=UPI00259B3C79|nr:ABC transporter permease [Solwaraspora sp. WMMA2056]WJK43902.1 ABC transporter permease [Solwaraspora sp. WMMA2056]